MTGTQSQYSRFLPAWDGAAYAANTDHHRRYDDAYLATLPLAPTDRVLDLGCGSGDLTAVVASRVPDGHVVGIDAQPSMIEEAERRARPNQSFAVAPVQGLVTAVDGPFDVVFSRAVLHWVPDDELPGVLRACREVLRPGGVLRVECGGGDNVPAAVDFLNGVGARYGREPGCPWNFQGSGSWLDRLLAAGFEVGDGFVRTNAQRRSFDRAALLGLLQSQFLIGYEATIDPADHEAFRADVEEHLDELRRADGSYDLTFVRLDALTFAA